MHVTECRYQPQSAKMIILVLVLCFLWGICLSGPLADNYMDMLLGDPLKNEILKGKLDPTPLPDFYIPFKYEFGPIPISGRVDYFNGSFQGLSKIRRLSECEGPIISLNELKIECFLNLFGMSAEYDAKARIEQLPGIPFQVTAYVNETHIRNGISGKPASLTGQLKLFEITQFGDINVRLSGLGMLQYVYNAVEERFRERVREELIKIIMQQFAAAFQKAIMQLALPKIG